MKNAARQLAFVLLGLIIVAVLSFGGWFLTRTDDTPAIERLEPGDCFILVDGPARGSGEDGNMLDPLTTAQDEYPTIDCDSWAEQPQPWLVYRVEWAKPANGDPNTAIGLENSCPDVAINYGHQTVTCLANLEFENS